MCHLRLGLVFEMSPMRVRVVLPAIVLTKESTFSVGMTASARAALRFGAGRLHPAPRATRKVGHGTTGAIMKGT
jgi:hypothetical protein